MDMHRHTCWRTPRTGRFYRAGQRQPIRYVVGNAKLESIVELVWGRSVSRYRAAAQQAPDPRDGEMPTAAARSRARGHAHGHVLGLHKAFAALRNVLGQKVPKAFGEPASIQWTSCPHHRYRSNIGS